MGGTLFQNNFPFLRGLPTSTPNYRLHTTGYKLPTTHCLSAICFFFTAGRKSPFAVRERSLCLKPSSFLPFARRLGRGYKGSLRTTRPDDLAALVIKEALARVPGLDPKEIDDVILGCAMPEGEQGMNVARIAALRAGLPVETSAMTVNRFCASGLQAIALAAERIRSGAAQIIIAGGTESMSMVPMGGNKISPNPWLVDHYPDTYINMGLGTENIAVKFGVSREQADQFSVDRTKKRRPRSLQENSRTKRLPSK